MSIIQQLTSWLGIAWIWFLSIFVHWGWVPNNLTAGPAVFVAEDEYQIVWETGQASSAWVTIGGKLYADTLAGNLVLDQKAHKVRVPMEALDAAGGYEIHWQHVLSQNIGSLYIKKGNHKAQKFDFRPVDFSDGLQIYHIADTHSNLQPGAQTAGYWGDKLDLLILNGDIIHNPEFPADRNFALKLAHEITGGTRPVLYTRGNHETRGAQANNGPDRYLGTPDKDRWYFTTRIGPLWIAVFDCGELREDDYYTDRAYFDAYRERETRFFERVAANAATEFDAPGVEHRLLVTHQPFMRPNEYYTDVKRQWAALAGQMNIDLALAGHNHAVTYHPAGSSSNGVTLAYPLIVGSHPAHAESANGVFTAAAVEYKDGGIKAWFTDQSFAVSREIVVR